MLLVVMVLKRLLAALFNLGNFGINIGKRFSLLRIVILAACSISDCQQSFLIKLYRTVFEPRLAEHSRDAKRGRFISANSYGVDLYPFFLCELRGFLRLNTPCSFYSVGDKDDDPRFRRYIAQPLYRDYK